MPELPEVETIRRALEREVLGRTLTAIHIKERIHLLKNCTPNELREALTGRELTALGRCGKFLVFEFGPWALVLHLRMSGRLLLSPADHTRLILKFERSKTLYLDDARRFAMLYLTETSRLSDLEPLRKLGIEPFSAGYTSEAFQQLLQTRQEIKRLLLDQRKIAGLGNIYASEALFEAGVDPRRPANSLTRREAENLFEVIPRLLERAIEVGGTSFDKYRTPQGKPGRFQEEFSVYSREGAPCPRCTALIARTVQGGRSSFYCPRCQR
jgi:formamidopyrimidine-DNA glycosylase